MPHISEKRLYLTADRSKVVEEGSPDAAFLFVAEGGQVSDEDARKYGLEGQKADAKPREIEPIFRDDKPTAEAVPEAPERAEEPRTAEVKAEVPAEDKAVETPRGRAAGGYNPRRSEP